MYHKGAAYVNLKSKIAKLVKTKSEKKKVYNYQAEIVWEARPNEELHTLRSFLNGKAVLMVKKVYTDPESHKTFDIRLSLLETSSKTGKTRGRKDGLQLHSSNENSELGAITEVWDVTIAGKDGNIIALGINQHKIMLLHFSRNGKKLLSKSVSEIDFSHYERKPHTYQMELRLSPSSRYLVVSYNGNRLCPYKIAFQRYLEPGTQHAYPKKYMPEPVKDLIWYDDGHLVVFLYDPKKKAVEIRLYTFYKGKGGSLAQTSIKQGYDLELKKNFRFYRLEKDGKIYFFDQKVGVYALTI